MLAVFHVHAGVLLHRFMVLLMSQPRLEKPRLENYNIDEDPRVEKVKILLKFV